MADWRKTRTPGVYVSHSKRCPCAASPSARCRCEPSRRGRRRNAATGKPEWQKPVTKDRNEVLSWLGANDKALDGDKEPRQRLLDAADQLEELEQAA